MCSSWKMDSIRQMDCLYRNCDAFQLMGAWGRLLPVGRERKPELVEIDIEYINIRKCRKTYKTRKNGRTSILLSC